ncbi:helix-turn-helix domain-containing protein [Shewanella xiamenensis]|uniref:helix-turn-helix domain-containing protein n=1 Tax=Shewanella xiamenensis TaxID=332186 RepID=UPI003CC79E87
MKTLKPSDIAQYCDVHQRTVSRWIAKGQLKGHKLPGRGNYRVLVDDSRIQLRSATLANIKQPIPFL